MDLAFIWLALNSLAIAAIALHQYVSGKTYELIANFANIAATMVLVCTLIVLFAFLMPADSEVKGGFITLQLVALFVPAGLAFLYLLSRLKSNEGRFSYLFFALLVAQQVWYAYSAESPHSAMMLLAFIYIVFAVAIITLGGLAGMALAYAFPKSEQKHKDWINATLADPKYVELPIPFEVKFFLERATAPPLVPKKFKSPLSVRFGDWGLPSDLAGALAIYALLNPIVFSLLFFYK